MFNMAQMYTEQCIFVMSFPNRAERIKKKKREPGKQRVERILQLLFVVDLEKAPAKRGAYMYASTRTKNPINMYVKKKSLRASYAHVLYDATVSF
jgi:hypothetical protein